MKTLSEVLKLDLKNLRASVEWNVFVHVLFVCGDVLFWFLNQVTFCYVWHVTY